MKELRRIRQERGLTQAELAREMSVTQSMIAMWERGTALPNAGKVPILADLLQCSIDELYGRTPPEAAS